MDHTIAREDAVFIGIGWRYGRSESESRFPVDGAIDEKSRCFGLSDKPASLGENSEPIGDGTPPAGGACDRTGGTRDKECKPSEGVRAGERRCRVRLMPKFRLAEFIQRLFYRRFGSSASTQ
jgi:hypothetical protein